MAPSQRLILVRHGDTLGESSIRYHGRNDVALSEEGREQIRQVASVRELARVDRVVASSLSRARESAELLVPHLELALEDDFREVHFGRWEGLTAEEIEAIDPELFARWRQEPATFDYPEGERRVDFRKRVHRGIERWLPAEGETVLAVLHKGVIRVVVAHLCEVELGASEPALAGIVVLERSGPNAWQPTSVQAD